MAINCSTSLRIGLEIYICLIYKSGIQSSLKNSNSDFSKYSLIRNTFRTQWIQRIGPIYDINVL